MSKNSKPAKGISRGLIYAMIPAGFILLVLILMVSGFWTQETT